MALNTSDLLKRIMFGAVYVVITSACTLASWYTTVLIIAVTAALCCYEFLRMARNQGYRPYVGIGTITAGLIPLACTFMQRTDHVLAGGIFVAFVAGVIMLLRYFASEDDTIIDVALTLFAYLYTGLVLSSFILLRGYVDGLEGGILGFLTLASVWINDAFAYLGGSLLGKHKMAPRISPKKSWEGLAFGLVGSILVWLLVPVLVPSCGFGFVWAALIGLFVGIFGVIGDLTESHIKRGFNAKDSGDILPGHGGMLDRSDSLIFAACTAYVMVAAAPFLFQLIGFSF